MFTLRCRFHFRKLFPGKIFAETKSTQLRFFCFGSQSMSMSLDGWLFSQPSATIQPASHPARGNCSRANCSRASCSKANCSRANCLRANCSRVQKVLRFRFHTSRCSPSRERSEMMLDVSLQFHFLFDADRSLGYDPWLKNYSLLTTQTER